MRQRDGARARCLGREAFAERDPGSARLADEQRECQRDRGGRSKANDGRIGTSSLPGRRVVHIYICRGVAQPGRALGSGPRGRWFKSTRPDQFLKNPPEICRVQSGSSLGFDAQIESENRVLRTSNGGLPRNCSTFPAARHLWLVQSRTRRRKDRTQAFMLTLC